MSRNYALPILGFIWAFGVVGTIMATMWGIKFNECLVYLDAGYEWAQQRCAFMHNIPWRWMH